MKRVAFFLCLSLAPLTARAESPGIASTADSTPVQLTIDTSIKPNVQIAQAIEGSDKVKPDIHYVPTPQQLVDVMLLMAEVNKDDLLYDLGSGDGRLVITAAKNYGARGIGIDIDPERIAEAKTNAAAAGVEDKVEFRQADLFTSDFKDATVITLYLLDELNERLRPQLLAQVKPGTRIVSHAFGMGDWQADAERTLKIRGSEYTAYSWVVPANMSGRWKINADRAVKGLPGAVSVEQTFQKFAVRPADGGDVIGEGGLWGNEFTLTINKGPGDKPAMFTGTINGNSITASMLGKRGSWKAEREAGTEKPLDQPK